MPIIFARIDDRLIHGQIVQAWLPTLNVDEVIIPVCKEHEERINPRLLRLSLPYEYKLTVLDSHACMRYALDNKARLFLLMSTLKELTDLIEDGFQIKSVNIGGMHFKENAQKLADHVFLDEEDKKCLRLLRNLGISIDTRAVPNSQSISLDEVLL